MANEFIARKGLIALEDSQITGSLSISSTLKIPGFNNVSASLAAAVAGGDNLGNHTATQNLNMGGNAITSVGNVDGVDVSALNSSFNTLSGKTLISSSAQIASSISGSFTAASASFSTRVTANDAKVSYTDAAVTNVINAAGIISSSAQISSDISGSFTAASASFSTRVTANDAKLTANTSNVTSAGALMDSELAEIATVKGLTKTRISGSFTAASASFSTRVTANEATSASFSTRVTANEATSASFSTRVTANDAKVSYTDAAVTSVINAAGIISSSAQFGSSDDVTFRTIEATSLTVTSITSSIVTSSIVQTEGSNIFGDASTDTHTFNGNITASGNISSSGQLFAATLSAGAVSSTLATAVITRLGNDAIPIAKLTEDAITIGGAGAITLGNSATVANILKGSTAISSSAQIATNISGAFTAASSSFSTRVTANDAKLTANTSNVTSAGALMDSELAEIATVKGLTKAGISGSFTAASSSFSTRVTTNDAKVSYTDAAVKTKINAEGVISSSAQISSNISGSFTAASSSFSTRVTANDAKLTANTSNVTSAGALMDSELSEIATVKGLTKVRISGSFTAASASFSTRVTANETITAKTLLSSSAQIASNISGSFTAASASFSTRVTANDAKLTANTSNVTSAGALMDSELAEIATVKGLTKVRISGSFTAASASFSTRITANEATSASFSTRVTANEATSASLSSRITTNTGNIGTTTNALTVDNATLQLNSGTTFNGSAARTISIKDGGVDSDALAANIAVTQLTASIISSSGTITADSFTGNGLSIDGPQNSHIEVGTHIVGFDTAGVNNFHITGSGLIVSGAMADSNHHNMVKIGNVELVDFNNAISPNEFLIRNVQSLKITSGSDGGDVAGTNAGNLFEHNGTDFKLYRNNSAVITVDASTTTFNNTNVSFVANAFFKATVEDPGSNGHFLFTVTDPGSSPQQTKAVNVGDVFKALTGAVTASAVSASEKIITSELSAPGDLTIDADGADILLKDGGTEFGRFKRDSSNFVIKSATNNKDIVFRGVDDSSTITALTLDMSDAGKAIFTSNISASGFISASSFAGDGSGLTNVTATATIPAGTYSSSLQTLGNITSSGDISASGTIIGNEITSSKLLITKTGAASNETLISLVGSAGVEEFSVDEDGDLTCNDINVVNRDIKGNGTTRLTLGGTNLFSGDVRVNNTTATLSLRCSDSSIVKDQTMGKISLATNDGDTNDSADIKFIATEDHSNDPNSGTKIEFRADKNAGEGDETDTLMLTLNPNTGSIIESVHQNIYDTGSTALATNSAFGDIVKFGGTSTTAGGLYYLKPDGTWAFADADAAGTATSSLAVAVGTNSSTDGMCLRGFVNPFTDPGAGIGNPVYVSTTVGRIQSTAPNGTGDVVRIVGYQYGTDLVYFNPSNDFIIHA